MKRLLIPDAARADLRGISTYGEREWGTARTKLYVAAIRERLQLLRLRPEIGVTRKDIATGYSSVLAGRHIIFYRIERNAILIIRILHQRMDAFLHIRDPG
jgi:toxin ParE1/3/4